MKVLITAPALTKTGGVSHYISTLLPQFTEEIYCFPVGSRSENESPIKTILRLVSDNIAFARVLRAQEPDVVHLNPSLGWKALARDAGLLCVAKLAQRKVVVLFHGWDEQCEREIQQRVPWLFRLLFGRADCVMVLARKFQAKLRRFGYRHSIFQVAAPVHPAFFDRAIPSRATSARQNRGINILYLARLEKTKGIYEALDAFHLLKEAFPDATLTVAGDGSERSRAMSYTREKSITDVQFAGHLEEKEKIQAFCDADLYVFPSHTEGLPISLLEAMAVGLPIITSAVGGIPDFFEDGVMGYMSPDLRPATLAQLMNKLLNNPELRARIRKFNSQYARNHFSPGTVASQLERIYRLQLAPAS